MPGATPYPHRYWNSFIFSIFFLWPPESRCNRRLWRRSGRRRRSIIVIIVEHLRGSEKAIVAFVELRTPLGTDYVLQNETTHLRGIPAAIHRLSELPDWQSRAFRPFVKRNVEEKRWDTS
ncbi:hypothetical protein AMJ39_03315 [candidate division TA06 bacterium DG_24]|uniref:Uncharacterized protein n=3 Tax=Bacteria division TA06 TaxID=1156500 RepID=A0A0S8J7U0_UNCT6|nr:MAG: hypothetical protein AMJ39_03315 [candidate division TA06 bacterium DG_24]KPK68003.1 MAG: hypothetical protein AMJ82_09330 [candidate division TA06 bacterium SM23_40]KPL05817.1 MAG: hypothetical protein AMJ71_10795 [candidate division TA06 bacterium SM1_40]